MPPPAQASDTPSGTLITECEVFIDSVASESVTINQGDPSFTVTITYVGGPDFYFSYSDFSGYTFNGQQLMAGYTPMDFNWRDPGATDGVETWLFFAVDSSNQKVGTTPLCSLVITNTPAAPPASITTCAFNGQANLSISVADTSVVAFTRTSSNMAVTSFVGYYEDVIDGVVVGGGVNSSVSEQSDTWNTSLFNEVGGSSASTIVLRWYGVTAETPSESNDFTGWAKTEPALCSLTVTRSSGTNFGHSDKTASTGNRSRGDFTSTPPSGQKPKKN